MSRPIYLAAVVAALSCGTIVSSSLAADRPPNVLFIMSDDLGTYLSSFGNVAVETPNIDRLGATGVRFDQAYCQFPLCGPSRVSLLSGKRPSATKVYVNEVPLRYALPDVVTLPQAFQNAGYHTVKVGKLYHGNPYSQREQGWQDDHWDDAESWLESFWFDRNSIEREIEQIGVAHGAYKGAGSLDWVKSDTPPMQYPDGMLATVAIEKMRENRDRPFFLAVGFFLPHTPWIAPEASFEEVDMDAISVNKVHPSEREDLAELPRNGNFDAEMSDLEKREAIKAYYASMQYMDAQVGRLLDELESLGLAEDTIVVFLGDHGYQLGHHGMWHKYGLFDQTLRTPLVIRAPGTGSGAGTSFQPVELVDIYPTLMELAGIEKPEDLHGRSLVPLLENPERDWNNPAYSMHLPVNRGGYLGRSVRWDRWHYFEWKAGEKTLEFLFNLQNDPNEWSNLSDLDEYREQVARGKAWLAEEDRKWPYHEAALDLQRTFPPDLEKARRINRIKVNGEG